ncbi:MAG: PAC2 family protein [Actinobacteria bacterium]|nr:PAC2 family protein [Actinomycetota bacterium]
MKPRYELHADWPTLDKPVLVVHLTGWIDASGAGAAAVASVDTVCATTVLATFDGDAFIDYRARRPTMELREGVNTRLVWDDIELRVGHDGNGKAVLTLTGPEPDSQWRAFAQDVTQLAGRLGVRQMVALGAYPYAIPHTRPPRLSSSSPSPEVLADLPYLKNSVDVPAGMSSVLEHALSAADIASLGVWVQVPHYVSAMSYPAASLALLQGLSEVTGLAIAAGELAHDAEIQRHRIDQLVAGNDEHGTMVRQLEALYDRSGEETMSLGDTQIPSGDDLAAEFERFLREQES